MSRLLYHTDGLILGNRPAGESSCYYFIFTERLGRVTALATGVRELKSKLRYSLSESGLVKIALVRGRGVWRIVYAEPIRFDLKTDSNKRAATARLGRLLIRFVVDEGRRVKVWRETVGAYEFLMAETFSPEALANFELLASLRLLAALGYCEFPSAFRPLAATGPWHLARVEAFTRHRQIALAIVEQAFYHSHL